MLLFAVFIAFTASGKGAVREHAVDTGTPCAQAPGVHASNAHATIHLIAESPPYALCLRPKVEKVDRVIATKGRWSECDMLPILLPPLSQDEPAPLFVDVGANVGACSMLIATRGYRVVSFEPTPPTYAALAAAAASNVNLFPHMDIRLVNAGVSDAKGQAVIFAEPGHAGNSITAGVHGQVKRDGGRGAKRSGLPTSNYTKHTIKLETLDGMLPGHRISLLKMDCQGHELRALRGARQLLSGSNRIQVIKFEFYPLGMRGIGDDPIDILKLLHATNYKLEEVGGHAAAVQGRHKPLTPREFGQFVAKYEESYTDIVARAGE